MAVSTRIVLSDINSILVHRVQILEDILHRLRTTAVTIERFQKSKPNDEDAPIGPEESTNEHSNESELDNPSMDESILSSNKLDDVLQRAKEIRNGLTKKTSSSSSSSSKKEKEISNKPVSLSAYVKSTASSTKKSSTAGSSADTASVVSSASRKPPVPPSNTQITPRRSSIVPPPPSAVYDFHADISSQLDFFRTHSPSSLNPLLKMCITKELYVAQAKRLTKATGRPVHPQSMCYAVMRKKVTTAPRMTEVCTSSVDSVAIRLKQSFQSLQKHFERHMKSRLERTSLSQLSSSDREEVLLLWLKGQKLLQLYEHYCYRLRQKSRKAVSASSAAAGGSSSRAMLSNSDVCLCETCRTNRQTDLDLAQLVQSVLHSTAYYCPLTAIPDNQNTAATPQTSSSSSGNKASSVKVPKGVPAGLSEPEQLWFITNKRALTAFHNSFDNNAKFLIESVCGQNELTQVVSRLKECSRAEISSRTAEKVLSNAGGSSSTNRAQWEEGLKMFRNVHCILTKEAQDDSTCVFLNKQS